MFRHKDHLQFDAKPEKPPPDPKLFATYDGSLGEPEGPKLGTETGPVGKLKDKLS